MDPVPVILLSLLWALAAAGIAWNCASLASQITYITLADGRRQERRLPLLFRMLLPFAPNLFPVFRSRPFDLARANLKRRIVAAGFEGLLSPDEFLALRVLLPVGPGLLWMLLVAVLLRAPGVPHFLQRMIVPLCLLGPLWLYAFPGIWLRRALTTRHNSIRRSLPFLLDILTLSVEAGIDFMTALQRHVEHIKIDPLGEELIRVIREIQVGKTRREALRDLGQRVNLPDLRSVVNALVQADELGVSIGTILRIQSDQIRQRRFERAEKLANEAPVKMLFPLLLFIFPAVFLILLGPVLNQLFQAGF